MAAESNLRRLAGRAAAALLFFLPAAQAQSDDPAARCVACHGPQGQSTQPQIPSLAAQPRIFLENQLVLIREGLREVPAMQGLLDGLSDADLVALAKYFAAQPPRPAAVSDDPARYASGQALAGRMRCASCHLPQFQGRDQMPRLAGQNEPFLRTTLHEYRDQPGPGRDTAMSAVLYGLNDAQLDALAHFMSHFQGTAAEPALQSTPDEGQPATRPVPPRTAP